MTQTSWPFENADTTETQYSYLFDRLKTSGVAGFPNDTALKVTGDSSGMNAKTAAGFAIVRGFMYYSDAVVTNTISASSSNPRIDLIILRLDPTANTIVQAVLTGTPSSSPTAPALTQTTTGIYEIEIGRVTVPALATVIAAGNVSDTRNCLSHGVGIWTTAQRPSSPTLGRLGWSTTNSVLELWNGSAWITINPGYFDASAITTGIIATNRIAPTANQYEMLTLDGSYNIVGFRTPKIANVFYNNPTVGTSFTTSYTNLEASGSTAYQVTFTSWVKDTDTSACTVTARLTIGSTNYDHTTYIPAGFTGQVTAVRYFETAVSTSTNIHVTLKASTGSRNIDTTITAIGFY
jgi:hypothetical protein